MTSAEVTPTIVEADVNAANVAARQAQDALDAIDRGYDAIRASGFTVESFASWKKRRAAAVEALHAATRTAREVQQQFDASERERLNALLPLIAAAHAKAVRKLYRALRPAVTANRELRELVVEHGGHTNLPIGHIPALNSPGPIDQWLEAVRREGLG